MAKDVKKNDDDLKQDMSIGRRTREQDEDEKKDRERLRSEHRILTPEKIGELQTELAELKTKFAADITALRDEFAEKKAELEQQIGSGGMGYNPVPSGGMPTNETLADGSSRRSLTIPLTA